MHILVWMALTLRNTHKQRYRTYIGHTHILEIHTLVLYTLSHSLTKYHTSFVQTYSHQDKSEFQSLCSLEKTEFLKNISTICKENTLHHSPPPLDNWSFLSRVWNPPFLKYKHAPRRNELGCVFWGAIPSIPLESFVVSPKKQQEHSVSCFRGVQPS